jgi:hypothetical protein
MQKPQRFLLGLVMVMAAVVAGVAPASMATASRHHDANGTAAGLNRPFDNIEATSNNWAGYAAHGGTYHSVSASWIQPAVTCGTPTSHASFWVGLDGYSDATVEQTGATSDCDNGQTTYYAWFETYPNPEQQIKRAVAPGDAMSASVTYGSNPYFPDFTLTIKDATQGWTFSTEQFVANVQRSSAEAIAEAPLGSNGRWPLANFGMITFTNTMVDGHAIGDESPTPIDMVQNGVTDATTSPLSNGTDFSVAWKHS